MSDLSHFGVKGMRWGVRKNRTDPTTLTKSERGEARKNIKALRNRVFDEKYNRPNEITGDQYNKLSTKGVTIRKGQTLTRITQRKDEKLRDITYVAYKPGDKDIYRSVMPLAAIGGFGGHKTYKNSYEATFKALDTLRSPSEKARVDALVDILDTPSVTLKNGKTVTGRKFMQNTIYDKDVKNLNNQQLGLRYYKEFAQNQFSDTPLNSAYFKSLRDKGFNTVVDDNDRGHLANTPLIILNPNGTLKKMGVKALSADDINQAQRRLKIVA